MHVDALRSVDNCDVVVLVVLMVVVLMVLVVATLVDLDPDPLNATTRNVRWTTRRVLMNALKLRRVRLRWGNVVDCLWVSLGLRVNLPLLVLLLLLVLVLVLLTIRNLFILIHDYDHVRIRIRIRIRIHNHIQRNWVGNHICIRIRM